MKKLKVQTIEEQINEIESRFKIVSTLDWDLSKFPMKKDIDKEFETDKDKSQEYAEVFTPLHIVDEMLMTIPEMSKDTRNMDLCSGYGQFSIRMIRKFYKDDRYGFNLSKYLKESHFFNELQVSSCYKLLWIFGSKINLYIGDALKLGKLPYKAHGIWYYLDEIDAWVNITGFIGSLFQEFKNGASYKVDKEVGFVGVFNSFTGHLRNICKEYKMSLKHMAETKAGRLVLTQIVREASAIEVNWQNVETPEWVVKEMCRLIPDIKELKRVLVLFNVEFIECLIKDMGVRASRIEFGSDSLLESAFVEKVYGVHAFSVGKNLESMKLALDPKAGRYDVVFSNPPYQVMDGGGGLGTSAKPLYHEIVMYVIDYLKPLYVCMITPSRWMAGGRGLDDYRIRMLKDKRIRLIQDFPAATGSSAVFASANLPGGVSYFMWDKNHNGSCEFNGIQRDIGEFDVLVRDNILVQILRKVIKHTGFYNRKVSSQKPFGIRSNFKDWVPDNTPGSVRCYSRRREIKYVLEGKISQNSCKSWAVFGAKATGHNGEIFTKENDNIGYRNIFIGERGAICTETYLVLDSFGTRKEAENFYFYTQTKFFQIMLSLRLISQNICKEMFSWVPDMGDYSRSYTDEELYQHFNLTKKEIEHIEKSIKTLN